MTRKQKRNEIEAAFYRVAHGVQIPILELSKVFDAGEKALKDGSDLDAAIREAVKPYREVTA